MKKLILFACALSLLVLPQFAMAASGADLGKPVKIKLGHTMTKEDYRGAATEYFAELVKEMSGGNMTVTTFPSETLITSQEAMKAVGSNVTEMGAGALAFSVSEVPALAPLDIPGIYDATRFREVYAAIRPALDAILATQGVKTMLMFDETDSVFYLNRKNMKAVHTPADIKGLRLRDHGRWIGEAISSWGAAPMTLMPGDLAVALDRGTVDGGFTGWGFVNTFRCYEAAPAITFTGLAKSTWAPVMVSLDFWNGLTQGQRDILSEAALKAELRSDELLIAYKEDFLKNVKAANGTVYEMTPEERQVFVDLAKPLIEKARGTSGELGNKLIDAFLTVK